MPAVNWAWHIKWFHESFFFSPSSALQHKSVTPPHLATSHKAGGYSWFLSKLSHPIAVYEKWMWQPCFCQSVSFWCVGGEKAVKNWSAFHSCSVVLLFCSRPTLFFWKRNGVKLLSSLMLRGLHWCSYIGTNVSNVDRASVAGSHVLWPVAMKCWKSLAITEF